MTPTVQIQDGSGSWQNMAGGVNVTPGNTVTIRLVDAASVWTLSCISTDETTDKAAINAGLTVNSVTKQATFTAPAAGKALRFQSQIEGGYFQGRAKSSYTATFGVYTLTADGNRVIAVDETFEGDATYGYVGRVNALIRSPNGWNKARDVDYTALSLSTASANGAFAVGTDSYTIQNYANASIVSVGGTNGLRVKANANNSNNTPSSRTGPCLSTPSFATMLPSGYDARLSVRISVWIKSENLSHANEGLFLYVDTQSNNQRNEVQRYLKTATKTDYQRLVLNGAVKTSGDISAPPSGHDCLQIELPWFGGDEMVVRSGAYSSGWPAAWSVRHLTCSAAGTWGPTLIQNLADAYVTLGVETEGTSGTLDVSFGRLMIEYKRQA